jgi:hypothetical protein
MQVIAREIQEYLKQLFDCEETRAYVLFDVHGHGEEPTRAFAARPRQ